MYYTPSGISSNFAGLQGLNLDHLNIPSMTELLKLYAIRRYSLETIQEWLGFYLAFSLFKYCVIVQGVAHRVKLGVASSENANQVAKLLPSLVSMTQKMLTQYPPPLKTSKL
jgi:hypothetical protein